MAFKDILSGYSPVMIDQLENVFSVKSTQYRQMGTLAALMSEANNDPANAFIPGVAQPGTGTPREVLFRFKKNDFCGVAAQNEATVTDLCSAGIAPSPFANVSVENDISLYQFFGRKYTLDPAVLDNWQDAVLMSERARMLNEAVEDIYQEIDNYFYTQARTAAGGVFDGSAVSAAGAIQSLKILDQYGVPRMDQMHQLRMILQRNDLRNPFMIHGYGPLYQYLSNADANIYGDTDLGIRAGSLAQMLNFRPLVDTVIEVKGTAATTEALAIEPGSARPMFWSDFERNKFINHDIQKRMPMAGPLGITLNHEIYYTGPCPVDGTPANTWMESIYARARLVTKPTDVNHCEMDGTNGIVRFTLDRCAAEVCPEDVV